MSTDGVRARHVVGASRIRAWSLTAVLIALLVPLGVLVPTHTASAAEQLNPIVVENQQQGTNTWQLGRTGFSISDDATGQVKGYASATSVNKGEQIAFHVSVNPVQSFSADIYRMGWYGGLGGRLMAQLGPIAGSKQSTCSPNSTTGIIDCNWSPSLSYTVPATWTSGVYLAVLTNAANFQSYITFVVRDDNRTADLLYQQSVTTYQAYNNYPIGTGKSLYEFNSYGSTVSATGTIRAAKVSFDRPYADGYGSGQFGGNGWNWERYYIGWMEQSGYDVAYSTDLDTHTNGARLLDFKGFLSVGHDEYWSKAMVNAATTARDAGVNLGFFGSNTAYWQVRFEPSAGGAANRVMVCYKKATLDPVKNSTATTLWRDPPANQPEQSLVGVQYTAHLQNDGRGAMYIVQNSDNWVWEGSGFSNGTQVPGVLGYESDRLMTAYPSPANTSYTTLSHSPITDAAGVSESASSAVYQAPSGAWVFASGTNHWSYGLGKPGVTNAGIQRATSNILNRFLLAIPQPASPPPAPSALSATAVSSSAVDLTWNDNSSNETSFSVERSLNGVDWSVVSSTLPPEATSYRDTGLVATTSYRYRVKATNAAGSSGYSNVVIVTTPPVSTVVFAESFPGEDGSPWDATRWLGNTGTTATLDVQSGGGRMGFQNVANARALAVSKMTKQADTDTLASFRFASTASASRGFLYFATRASGDWVGGFPGTSYFLQLTNDISSVQLWKSQAGTTTSMGSVSGMAEVTTAKQWLRFSVQGSTIRAKVWTQGAAEPANWELTTTDTSITGPGLIQLKWSRVGSATAPNDVILDDIAVSGGLATPAAPSGLAATAVSDSVVDLTWADNATTETGYTVERSVDGATGWSAVSLPGGTTSYRDIGLAPSTAYHYRVKATNDSSSSAYSNIANATTQAPPPQIPSTPTGLQATAVSNSVIDLTWTDNATTESLYTVERSRDGVTWTVLTSTLPAGTATYRDTGLTASTSYRYRVKASNASGSSGYSSIAIASTQAAPPETPAAPTGLVATAASHSAINLTWTDNANNETGFTVEQSPDGASWTELTSTLSAGSTSYQDTGLTPLTAYSYRVKATNVDGSSAYSNVDTAITQAPPPMTPAAPTGLTATATSSSAIDLAWSDNSTNETNFAVEQSLDGTTWTDVTTSLPIGTTSYPVTGLASSTSYTYRVRATNAAGSSAYSNLATATTAGPPPTPPAAPSGLTGTAASPTAVDLAWNDNSNNEINFSVEQSLDGTTWTEVTSSLPAGTTSYRDTGLAASTSYRFRVKAINDAGSSGYSNVVIVTTAPPDPVPPAAPSGLAGTATSSTAVALTWTDNANDETGYTVERSLDGNTWTVATAALPAGATSYTNTGLTASTSYRFRVKATNGAGSSGYSNVVIVTTDAPAPVPPAAPSGLAGTATSSTAVALTWTDNANNETGYTVERSLDGTTWTVATAALPAGATSYNNTGLTASTSYSFRVKATNAAGSSGYSNVDTVTTPAASAVVFAETFPGATGTPWDTTRWLGNTGTTATLDVQNGAGRMGFQNVANARALAVSKMTKEADTETLASFRYTSTSSASRGFMYLASRASGDWVSGYPGTSYFLQLTSDINTVQLWKSQAGTTTSLTSVSGVAAVTTAKQWVRFRVEGNTIRAKVWTDGTTEPANWELTATDSSITGTGLLQLKWQRSGSATAANDITFDDISVSTTQAPPDPVPPAAPSGLAGTATSSTAVALTWTDNANNETGYTVERSLDGTTWTVATAALPAGATSYNNTGLTASTSYSFRVKATNAAGSSGYSNVVIVTTDAPAPEPPAAPSGLAGTATSSTAVALTWTDNANNETGYTVERSLDGTTWTVATAALPAGATSYNNTGLTASTSYSFRVKATNAAGSSGYSNVVIVTTDAPAPEPPAAPSGLAGTATSSTAVALTWTDNANNETGYTVERSLDGTTWTVATAALPAGATSYNNTGLTASTSYSFRVKATNAAGSSGYSNVDTVTTPAASAVVFAETFPGATGTPWDTTRWLGNTGTTATLDVQSGAGRMGFQNVANARALAVSKMTKEADTETLASFRYTSASSASRGYLYLAARASGDWVSGYPGTSYFLQLTNDISNVQLWKSQAGTTTSLKSTAGVAAVTTAKQWVRFRVEGNTISAKVWTDGTTEPANWELTATDSSITGTGLLQLKWQRAGSATAANDVTFDDISVTRLEG